MGRNTPRERQTRIRRIKKYESYMDEAQKLLSLQPTPEQDERLSFLIKELEAYYGSARWRGDFEADEAGLLPDDLKRGVLSEDGLWELLREYDESRA